MLLDKKRRHLSCRCLYTRRLRSPKTNTTRYKQQQNRTPTRDQNLRTRPPEIGTPQYKYQESGPTIAMYWPCSDQPSKKMKTRKRINKQSWPDRQIVNENSRRRNGTKCSGVYLSMYRDEQTVNALINYLQFQVQAHNRAKVIQWKTQLCPNWLPPVLKILPPLFKNRAYGCIHDGSMMDP